LRNSIFSFLDTLFLRLTTIIIILKTENTNMNIVIAFIEPCKSKSEIFDLTLKESPTTSNSIDNVTIIGKLILNKFTVITIERVYSSTQLFCIKDFIWRLYLVLLAKDKSS